MVLVNDFIMKRPITVELIESLYDSVKYCRLSHCEEFLDRMDLTQLCAENVDGETINMGDIRNQWEFDSFAEYVKPIYFYGGPQTAGIQTYNRIQGNVLEWVMDSILYEYIMADQHIFEKLGIPV